VKLVHFQYKNKKDILKRFKEIPSLGSNESK
jgi:hypothetical protein